MFEDFLYIFYLRLGFKFNVGFVCVKNRKGVGFLVLCFVLKVFFLWMLDYFSCVLYIFDDGVVNCV